jgi:hypothetical protein
LFWEHERLIQLVGGSATPSDSGILSMDSEDYTSTDSSSEGSGPDRPAFTMPQVPMTRKIKRNTTKRGASMFNAPLGEDLWKNVQVVEIEDNVAEEDSMMINYHLDERGMALAREQQEWRQAQHREQRLWEQRNGCGFS